MKTTTLTLIASAMAMAAIAGSPAAHAGPASEKLCEAQTWPRPVPEVVGKIFDPSTKQLPAGTAGGALACWDDIRIVAADGRDAAKVAVGTQQIAFVSPSPGTPIGRNAQITVELARIDYSLPPAYHPCDWLTTTEVADILGVENRIETESIEDRAGSVDPMCIYRSPGDTAVTAHLYQPLAFPIDAKTEFATYTGFGTAQVDGLGLAAKCLTGLQGTQYRPYNEVVVLLDGNRLLEVQGLGAEPCDTLKQLAQKAIGRI
jgi:hypothetical protein